MSSIAIPTPSRIPASSTSAPATFRDKVRPVFAIKPGASSDITLKPSKTNNQSVASSQPAAGPYNPSPLLYGDCLYVLYDFGFLSCYDTRTGQAVLPKAARPRRHRHLVHSLTLGREWENLRPERRRRHPYSRPAPIQAAAHKLPRRNVHGQPGDSRSSPHHPHADKALLLSRDEVNRPHPAGMSVAGKHLDMRPINHSSSLPCHQRVRPPQWDKTEAGTISLSLPGGCQENLQTASPSFWKVGLEIMVARLQFHFFGFLVGAMQAAVVHHLLAANEQPRAVVGIQKEGVIPVLGDAQFAGPADIEMLAQFGARRRPRRAECPPPIAARPTTASSSAEMETW